MATIKLNNAATTEAGANNEKKNNGSSASQSYVNPFSSDPARYWEGKEYAMNIATTALKQIFGSLAMEFGGDKWMGVICSWGCVTDGGRIVHSVLRWREMPALALRVHGFEHDGWVIISLDESMDEYEVELADEHFIAKPDSRHEGIFCESLGPLIDRLVETGDNPAEYEAELEKSLPLECWAKKNGVQVVYL